MTLRKIGPNASVLETPAGAVLFSYEQPAALRLGPCYYRVRQPLSKATWAHIQRFVPADMTATVVPPEQFQVYLSEVATG